MKNKTIDNRIYLEVPSNWSLSFSYFLSSAMESEGGSSPKTWNFRKWQSHNQILGSRNTWESKWRVSCSSELSVIVRTLNYGWPNLRRKNCEIPGQNHYIQQQQNLQHYLGRKTLNLHSKPGRKHWGSVTSKYLHCLREYEIKCAQMIMGSNDPGRTYLALCSVEPGVCT